MVKKKKYKLSEIVGEQQCNVPMCKFKTTDQESMSAHREAVHQCGTCYCSFKNAASKNKHACFYSPSDIPRVYNEPTNSDGSNFFKKVSSSFRDLIGNYEYEFENDFTDLSIAVASIKTQVEQLIGLFLSAHKGVRLKLDFFLEMKSNKTGKIIHLKFGSNAEKILHVNYVPTIIDFCTRYVDSFLTIVNNEISGLSVVRIEKLGIITSKFSPTLAHGYLPLPHLANRSGLLNIQDDSGNCFEFSVLAAKLAHNFSVDNGVPYHAATGNERLQLKRRLEDPRTYMRLPPTQRLKLVPSSFSGMDIHQLAQVELDNSISLNVFKWESDGDKLRPLRLTTRRYAHHCNLLLVEKADLPLDVQSHYTVDRHFVVIYDILGFLGKRADGYKSVCRYCNKLTKSDTHENVCYQSAGVNITYPQEDNYKFKDLHKLVFPHRILYASFIYGSHTREDHETCLEIIGMSVIGRNANEGTEFYNVRFTDEKQNAVEHFFGEILWRSLDAFDDLKANPLPLEPTADELAKASTVTHCYCCGHAVDPRGTPGGNVIHLNHDHSKKGKAIGESPARSAVTFLCRNCNLGAKPKRYIPCFIHDLLPVTADCLIRQALPGRIDQMHIVPKGKDGISSILMMRKAMIMDSRSHMNKPLQKLAEYLSDDELQPLRAYVKDKDLFSVVRKGLVFPHNLITKQEDWQKTSLGSPDYFDITLGRKPTTEEFTRSEYILSKCPNLMEYAKLVMLSNTVITLAAMESFNRWAVENFGLVVYYDSGLPGYSNSVAHYISKPDYQYLKEPAIQKLLDESCIGGINLLTCKNITAKAERLGHYPVQDCERKHLLSLDFSSLYLSCLTELPHSDYRLLSPQEVYDFKLDAALKKPGMAYAISCRLRYPPEIKKRTASFPLVPTRECIKLGGNEMATTPAHEVHIVKLDQRDKKCTLLHMDLLKTYLDLGMELVSIDNVLEYRTKNYMEPFVRRCIEVRNSAQTKLHKTLAKNIGNFFIGKAMQRPYDINIKLVQDEAMAEKQVSLSQTVDIQSIREELAWFATKKQKALLDRHNLIAWHVLNLSKNRLYQVYYNTLVKVFGDRIMLSMISTDSYIAAVADEDNTFEDDLKKIDILEFGDKKTPGNLRQEHTHALSFVALNKKTYSILSACPSCVQRKTAHCDTCGDGEKHELIKGTRKQLEYSHQNLLDSLHDKGTTAEVTNFSRSKGTLSQSSIMLGTSNSDDRIWINNSHSYPVGYFDGDDDESVGVYT